MSTEDRSTAAQALELVQGVVDRAKPSSGKVDAEQVLAALEVLRELREELAGWEPDLIAAARRLGVSWVELAPVLGVASRQAAERRYLRVRPSESGEVTADERVQAVRDRRASDRAVTRWARENSASLRRLAGQVGALEDLAAAAQEQVDRVHRALADSEAATLLQPLATAGPHLRDTHPRLAEQINDLSEQTDQLRRDTRDSRRPGSANHGRALGPGD